ncbi:hypothetical protein AgCh_016785 [Apium graveolens]
MGDGEVIDDPPISYPEMKTNEASSENQRLHKSRGVEQRNQQKQKQFKEFSRKVASARLLGAGDHLIAGARVEDAGGRLCAEFQILDFINSSPIGLLLALVLLGYYINLMGRHFLEEEQGQED